MKVTLRLKQSVVSALSVSGLLGLESDIFLDIDNPTVELEEDQARIVLASENGTAVELVEPELPISKAQLQSLYTETLGTEPSNRLSAEKLQLAIDEFNRTAAGLADVVEK